MFKQFQILKDNGDGTIDIEAPVFKKFTLPHPTDVSGKKLSGAALVFMISKWVHDNAPSDNTVVDISATAFTDSYKVDSEDDGPIDYAALGLSTAEFPMPYAG